MMPHPMPVGLLEETQETEPSDEFADLLYGVGLVKAQEFFFGHASIVITLDLYGSPVEGLMG